MAGILGIKSCMLISIIITLEGRHLKKAGTMTICPKYGIQRFPQKNCNRYYECSNGILFAKTCDHDKLFDPESKRCLKANEVKCEQKEENIQEESTWDSITPRSRRYSNISQLAFNADGCPLDTNIKWRIPHQKCEKYYECKRGQPKVKQCPSGKLFDAEKLKCVKASNAQCDQFIYGDQEAKRHHNNKYNEFSCPDDYNIEWRVPHKNCNQYYQCKNGDLEPHRCPVNMVYNIDTRSCDSFKNVDCANRYVNQQHLVKTNVGGKSRRRNKNKYDEEVVPKQKEAVNKYTLQKRAEETCADPVTNGITLPFGDPNGYYICVDGEAVLKYCSAGLQYNHRVQKCDWLDTEKEDTYGNHAEQACKDNQETVPKTKLPHENCNQYYTCGKNSPVARYCQSGFLFDTSLRRCDWAANVNCGLRRYDDKR